MSSVKATYKNTSNNTEKVIEAPVDETKSLTDHINILRDQINVYLTQVLEEEKNKSMSSQKVTTVEEDDIEQQKKAEAAGEEDEEADGTGEQTVKKQKLEH